MLFTAVLVERKKSSPIIFENLPQTLTEAGLFIHPITYDDYGLHPSDEAYLEEVLPQPDAVEPLIEPDVNNNLEDERVVAPSIETQTSNQDLMAAISAEELDEDAIIRRALEEDVSDEFDADMQRRIEEMIDSVISAAKEDAEWLRESQDAERSNENLQASSDNVEASSENIQGFNESVEASKESLEVVDESPIRKFNYLPVESSVKVEITQSEDVPVIENLQLYEEVAEAAPLPPPRKRSTTTEDPKQETVLSVKALPSIEEAQTEPQRIEPELVNRRQETFEEETFSSQLPSRLHLSSLEIDNLSVCSLQAGRIIASEIDSNTIVTNEIDCKVSSNLPHQRSIEFPPGFIEEIVERVRCASRAEQTDPVPKNEDQQQAKDETDQAPVRPPLPTQFHSEYSSVPPPSFYQLRDFSEDEALHQMPQRRRRHQTKRKDSTSEEDYQRDQRNKGGRAGTSSDQSILGLGGQFARACGNALKESGGQLMEVLRASSKDENKRDLHIALIILIVICAGLILMGMGDKSVHHHHWDFFNPPDNHGRL